MKAITMLAAFLILGSAQAEAQSKPKLFGNTQESRQLCRDGLRSGNYLNYYPIDTTGVARNPAVGPNKKVAPLEADACVHMKTTASWQWVIRPSGSPMRWEFVDGEWKVYADDKCGNDADEVAYLEALPLAPSLTPVYADVPVTHSLGSPNPASARFTSPPPPPPPSINVTQTTTVTVEGGGDNTWKWIVGTTVVVGGGLLLADALGAFDGDDTNDAPPKEEVCNNPLATNYRGPGPCTYGPGGHTDPATSRIRDAMRGATPLIGFDRANKRLNVGLNWSFGK